MKKVYSTLFHFFLINFNLLGFAFTYLNIPFKTKKSIIDDTENDITHLFRSLIYNNIYINIEIGEPSQTIETFLISKDVDFYVSEKSKNDERTNTTNPDVDDVGCELEEFFDKSNSKSLDITRNKKYLYYGCEGNICYDYFSFKNENNENIKEKLEFILYKSTIGHRPSVIGLQFPRGKEENNFFNILKTKDIINSYFWMINYTSEYEGNFIVGEQPHKFDPINYKEDDLLIGHPYTYTAMQEKWGLRMDDILFKDTNFRPYHECYFYYEFNIIKGIKNLEDEIDKYLFDSFNNGTCFKQYIKYPYGPHKFYFCDKEKYKENMKYFPPLRFIHKEMNYTFELTYEDLFIEKYDKLILLIFFEDSGSDWYLGKPFLKKYPFIMNHDMKIVGFYKNHGYYKNNELNKNNDKRNNNEQTFFMLKILFIGLGVIMLTVFGIFIGKYLFKKKKRINTLEDDYDYEEAKNENIIN